MKTGDGLDLDGLDEEYAAILETMKTRAYDENEMANRVADVLGNLPALIAMARRDALRKPFTDALREDARDASEALVEAFNALAAANARIAEIQRDRASLSDKLHGTPCAEIRWLQEREELTTRVAELEAGLRDAACNCETLHSCLYLNNMPSNGCPRYRAARLLSRPADGE